MLQIGLTGGIGSGKSTVAALFGIMGAPVYYADKRAKQLLNTDENLKGEVKKVFGSRVYKSDGTVDRSALASKVFPDQESLAKLNQLVHPAVQLDYQDWIKRKNTPYIIHEAALIFEAGFTSRFDAIISVSAPEYTRKQRIKKRDGLSPTAIEERLERQYSQEYKDKHSDKILVNDGKQLLMPKTWHLHQKWLSSSTTSQAINQDQKET